MITLRIAEDLQVQVDLGDRTIAIQRDGHGCVMLDGDDLDVLMATLVLVTLYLESGVMT